MDYRRRASWGILIKIFKNNLDKPKISGIMDKVSKFTGQKIRNKI